AEDGIRDPLVTGIQTCALPISVRPVLPTCSGGLTAQTLPANYETLGRDILPMAGSAIFSHPRGAAAGVTALRQAADHYFQGLARSEERRVGKSVEISSMRTAVR